MIDVWLHCLSKILITDAAAFECWICAVFFRLQTGQRKIDLCPQRVLSLVNTANVCLFIALFESQDLHQLQIT